MKNIQEIIKKTTEHYAWCIENLPKENTLEFCYSNFVCDGVCYYLYRKYNILNELYEFSKEFAKGERYLCEVPSHFTTFEEILLTLRKRHKRLLEMADYAE